ncbi:hypothetical protein IQ06DRAFT_135222 [Phaeosphaeriaceae sp. SRC1lsM3a]|nr:hypothetical protein IQ06DRAFT_135222 [Stagonospora sp. SRC1lsM3a]
MTMLSQDDHIMYSKKPASRAKRRMYNRHLSPSFLLNNNHQLPVIMSSCGSFALSSTYGSNSTFLNNSYPTTPDTPRITHPHLNQILQSLHIPTHMPTSRNDQSRR